jgi:hypothetical protein
VRTIPSQCSRARALAGCYEDRARTVCEHPSSSAVNPSLTAIANALRVGDHLLERLDAPSAAGGALTSSSAA